MDQKQVNDAITIFNNHYTVEDVLSLNKVTELHSIIVINRDVIAIELLDKLQSELKRAQLKIRSIKVTNEFWDGKTDYNEVKCLSFTIYPV